MGDFVQVATLSDLADPGSQTIDVGDRMVVLIRQGSAVYCIDDVCTHDGGPLGDGTVEGFQIACPRHGALFDIRTGAALTMPATEATNTHEVKLVDDQIWVRLAE